MRGAMAEPEMAVSISEAGPTSATAPRRAAAPAASGWNSSSASLGEGVRPDPAQVGPAKGAPAYEADRHPGGRGSGAPGGRLVVPAAGHVLHVSLAWCRRSLTSASARRFSAATPSASPLV